MNGIEDLVHRLDRIEAKVDKFAAWMNQQKGADAILAPRRLWTERLFSGLTVGGVLTGFNWWLG